MINASFVRPGALAKKKAPPEGGALGVEAGFIQARNLSSSGETIRKLCPLGKSDSALFRGTGLLRGWWHIFAIVAGLAIASPAAADPKHGIAMYGEPALSPDFNKLPYVSADATQGGRLVLGETGGYDSLNPFVLKGRAPWALGLHTTESLLARSYDEPFTLYGLLAASVEVPEDRSWVEFTLREGARFSDGSTVTVEDVIWSFQTLGTLGHPRYRNSWKGVASIAESGPGKVRIELAEANRELPLILGLRPILKKAQFDGVDFESFPGPVIGSGPYTIAEHEPGRFIEFAKNPDWWGRDLPINRGLNNFERVRYEYFRNQDALWEAVKTGSVSLFHDTDPVRWAEGYDFPAMADGTLQRDEIAHSRPTGMEGFGFNTRREIFRDRRVREALALSFDWEWVNQKLYRGQYARITSYFGNSPLAHSGAAQGAERALLEPFADELPEGLLDQGWVPPVTDGSGRNRRNLRRAAKLLDEAGWTVKDGRRVNADGEPLRFEILVNRTLHETLGSLWRETLEKLGIEITVRLVDDAQYTARLTDYDYDMIYYIRRMSLSPGTEQRFYFGADGRDQPGTRNYMGIAEPAIEAAIDAMLNATDAEAFLAAVRAHDRVLTGGIYVIPMGVLPTDRVVWKTGFSRPEARSLYGWWGWWAGPGVWWAEP